MHRKTTLLLTEHVSVSIAMLIESFLGVPLRDNEMLNWQNIACGEHAELLEVGTYPENSVALLRGAAITGNVDLTKKVLAFNVVTRSHVNMAILIAAAHNVPNNDIFDTLVNAGGDPSDGMFHASCKGNMKIIEHLYSLGGSDYNGVLVAAAANSHLRAMQWALNHGAYDWDRALTFAATLNNKPMALVCKHNGAKIGYGLIGACSMGRISLAKFFVQRGAKNFNASLSAACDGGSQEGLHYMIECGATECSTCYQSIEAHRNLYYSETEEDED